MSLPFQIGVAMKEPSAWVRGQNLRQVSTDLRRFSDKLSASEGVTEKVAYIYRKTLERNLVREIHGCVTSCSVQEQVDSQNPKRFSSGK
jgi:transcription initiation factor TFIIB